MSGDGSRFNKTGDGQKGGESQGDSSKMCVPLSSAVHCSSAVQIYIFTDLRDDKKNYQQL